MAKRIYILVINFLLVTVISGCWDRVEINDIALVVALGFDKSEDGKYLVSVQIPLPQAQGGNPGISGGVKGNEGYYVDSSIGNTVEEAIDKIQDHTSRRFKFSHQRIVIIGEELARNGINQVLDFINRNGESRLSAYIIVAKGKAQDILNTHPQLEKIPSESIREMVKMGKGKTTREFLRDVYQIGKDPIIPLIQVTKNRTNNAKEEQSNPEIKNFAVFKDDKMVFKSSPKQTYGTFWMMDRFKGKTITFLIRNGKKMSVKIVGENRKISMMIKEGMPEFKVNLEVKGIIRENASSLNLEDLRAIHLVEKRMEQEIEDQIKDIIKKTLSMKIDSFGFGSYLFVKENIQWEDHWKKKWEDMLPDLKVKVHVDGTIEHSGFNTKGLRRERGDE